MPVKVTMVPGWGKKIESSIQAGLLEMVTDIHRVAVARAPVETSALRNSGEIEPVHDGYRVIFGSSRVPYARIRHYENKKNPSTIGYLAKAGDSIARSDISRYFRRKVDV